MSRGRWIIGGVGLVVGALATSLHFGGFELNRLKSRVEQLERERGELIDYAKRLSDSRRMAQVNVLDQYKDEAGRTISVLRWQQISPDGILGEPSTLEVYGSQIYFEALVIKFEHEHVGQGDPERQTSLALFRRVFGDMQEPDSGHTLDRDPPAVTTQSAAEESLHARLWRRFWDLIEDPSLAAAYGVRVAQIEAPAVPVKPGQICEISLDASGGLNIRKLRNISSPTMTRPAGVQHKATNPR